MTERLVAEEVDALVGEVELDVLARRLADGALARDRLLGAGHLRGGAVRLQKALADQTLDELVEQLGELGVGVLVAVAAQRFEHLGGELAALEQGVEDGLLEPVERAVGVVAGLAPERVRLRAAREPRVEQEAGELLEQRLQVDRVGNLGAVLGIRVEAHRRRLAGGAKKARTEATDCYPRTARG